MNLRIPKNFKDFGESVMSNFDGIIDTKIVKAIKGKKLFSQYAGWNFCGRVWWQNKKWHCEIWQYRCYEKTITCNTLEEIMEEVSNKYGSE